VASSPSKCNGDSASVAGGTCRCQAHDFAPHIPVLAQTQLDWLHLSALFLGTHTSALELRARFPIEAELFALVHCDFLVFQREVLPEEHTPTTHYSGVLQALEQPGIEAKLEEMQGMLETCRQSLDVGASWARVSLPFHHSHTSWHQVFLEGKCQAFPRFYFMSSADLLELLSRSSDTAQLTKYVLRCCRCNYRRFTVVLQVSSQDV